MSSTTQSLPQTPLPQGMQIRVAIAVAEWNGDITGALCDGALDILNEYGAQADVFSVPGAVELTFAASQLIETGLFDAVIVFGCVIRGDTPHFDYVCQSVTQGITQLNADVDTPVIFGLLTVENHRQALDRVGGPAGHKGREAAEAAIKMTAFRRAVDNLE